MACAIPLHFLIIKYNRSSSSSSSNRARPTESTGLLGSQTPPDLRNIMNSNGTATPPGQLDSNDPFGDNASSVNGDAPASETGDTALGPYDTAASLLNWRINLILLIPSLFDLVGSALSTIGLLYCTVSVYQLSRCTVIIVTAVLKAWVLKHPLSPNMWAGVAINAVAMILVGSTAFFEPPENTTQSETYGDARIGIMFILASCLVQGAQYVFEEKVMAFDSVPPLVLVGMEGIWGCILFLAFIFPFAFFAPGSDNGHYEDIWESFHMLGSNSLLLTLLIAFVLIVFLYNVFCIYITFLLNSIWHAIMDNCRPVAVWVCGLALYYSIGKVGEPWTSSSWIELVGMITLFYGTAVYNGNLVFMNLSTHVPGSELEEGEEEEPLAGFRDPLPATPRFGPSHTPKHTPLPRPPTLKAGYSEIN